MPLIVRGGKLLVHNGKLVTKESCCCGCVYCSAIVPEQLSVSFSGIANGSCTNASNLNGATVADFTGNLNACTWASAGAVTTLSCPGCNLNAPITHKAVSASMGKDLSDDYFLTVNLLILTTLNSFAIATFTKVFGSSKPNCDAWDGLEIPHSFTAVCDLGPAKMINTDDAFCRVSAV